jgi:hypothetical protein
MARVIVYSRHAFHHRRYPWQCPQIRPKAMQLGPLAQGLLHLPQLSSVQPRFAARATGAAQS